MTSVEEYIQKIEPFEKKEAFSQLRQIILENLPKGFEEILSYGMVSYVVPHSLYPKGYHCNPEQPLPFLSVAAQKNFIALYHMGIYADSHLLEWFMKEFPKYSTQKLDMGKSCIRFKKYDKIPYLLVGKLLQKVDVPTWIQIYENQILKLK